MERDEMQDRKEATAPARIGSYRVETRLGQGGMGEVFLACDERLGRRVAIKRIREEAGHAGQEERFRREARAAARLNHPAIVQVYDLVEDGSGLAIVMEYVEGRTLAERRADGLPAPALAVRWARDVAEGLAAAHAAGLVHRDLKAENVVVTPEGRAKILDFGLARPILADEGEESLTAHGALVGTYPSMSPEQASGRDVDGRSDLFSLGVLLYEMLTGRSPFRGTSPLDTLTRVLTCEPPPVSALRPDLPPRLAELVARLLAKDREARPRSAAEVARSLEEIASSPDLAAWKGAPPQGERWSVAETGDSWAAEPPTWPLPVSPASPAPTASSALAPLYRRRPLAAVVATVALLAVLAFCAVRLKDRASVEPLRIVVLPPQVVPAGEERLGLAASGTLLASLSTLAAFEALAPLDPAQLGRAATASAASAGSPLSPVAAARAAAADEVLAATIEGQGELGARLTLRRIQGSDGRVLWAEGFLVPTEPRDLRLLADAVAVHLRRAYSGHRLREGTPALDVRDEDYAELLKVKRRLDAGTPPGEGDLAAIEGIARRSPRFLEAHLLAALTARNLFVSRRDPAYLDRGRHAVQAARALAPGDPRPLIAQLGTALGARRPEEAREALAELERLLPGDPDLLALSGKVAEIEGDAQRAIAQLTAAVRRSPSWSNLFHLADLEARAGRTADARRHLETLLARNPGNVWGLDKLGNLELLMGDPARAEKIYLDLIRLQPQRSYYTNLGLARSLLGRPADAVAAYRKALELAPEHVAVTLNLADAELALGHQGAARSLYEEVLRRLTASEAAADLSAMDRMIKAQCLAHLGRPRDAVELAQSTLQQNPGDPEVVFTASLVYALVGDRASALVNAGIALDQGVQPRWFTIAAFGPFRDDPELRALLRGPAELRRVEFR